MAAVELAIVLPVMLLLLYGLVTFAAAFYTQLTVSRAVEEGARAVPFLPATATTAVARKTLIQTQIIESLAASSIVPVASGSTTATRRAWLESHVRSRITVVETACASLTGFTCFTITLPYPYGNADGTRILPSINLLRTGSTESWMPDTLSSRAVAQTKF